MGLISLTSKPVYYPKLKDLGSEHVIFEKAKYVESRPGFKFKDQMTYIFETDEPFNTEKGEFQRIGVSGGMIHKKMETRPYGGYYYLQYLGKNKIEQGPWAGQSAHAFDLKFYSDEEQEVKANPSKAEMVKQHQDGGKSDSLDAMMDI